MTTSPGGARAAKPPQGGFEGLFGAHHDFIRRSALALGVPARFVDDVVQDVFIVALRKLGDLDPGASARGWLYGILRNVARRAKAKDARTPPLHLAPPPDAAPDEVLDWRRAASVVETFLAGLDDEKREVFVLCELEGMSAPEVAAATQTKLNTVYSRLRTVRALFDKTIAREEARRRRKELR
ncbi:MAG: RNA polymerase sigma factor [Nannocystaceae bacterium]|nr:sigma-70 family RNA polymerase sigma factor [bacterium]